MFGELEEEVYLKQPEGYNNESFTLANWLALKRIFKILKRTENSGLFNPNEREEGFLESSG